MIRWMLLMFLSGSALLRHTFDQTAEGWIAAGKGGAVRITHDAADIKNGTGALAFDYTVGGGMAVMALPLAGVYTAHMDAVRFWMKTDMPTGLAVVLNEKKPGGSYSAICWSTGNTWQEVALAPSDFHLNEGPNDAADPDGTLDLDALESVGLIDLGGMYGARPDPNAPFVMESHAGKHSFFLDDFELSTGSALATRDRAIVDDFSTPQLQWLTLGGGELKPEKGGMRLNYQPRDEKGVVLTRIVTGIDLRGKEKLAFDISSERDTELVMAFEGRMPGRLQGPRYNANIEVVGGGQVSHREVLLSSFGDGQGELPPIKLDQLKTFSIVDASGQLTHETRKNSLWIGNIHAVGESKDQ